MIRKLFKRIRGKLGILDLREIKNSLEYQRGYPRWVDGRKIDQGVYFQTITQNLAEGKRIQWNTTYYYLLMYAAAIGLRRKIDCSSVRDIVLPIITVAVMFVGIWFVCEGQRWQRKERTWRDKNIYYKAGLFWYPQNQKEGFEKREVGPSKWLSVFLLFIITIVGGGLMTFSLLVGWI
jgi:hypothetical protein